MRLATFGIESLDPAPHKPVPFEVREAALRPVLERLGGRSPVPAGG